MLAVPEQWFNMTFNEVFIYKSMLKSLQMQLRPQSIAG